LAFLLIVLKTLPPEDPDPPSKPSFDMVYAQYAVMGGFVADVANLHNTLQKVPFTTEGILFLAKHGRFLEMSRSNIQDKSKADTLAKGLVCFQVLWIVGQAIERKVAGYPITLLEVHTIVHVVCAVVMYGFWIRKPFNVQDPTVIDFRDRLDILAFMLQISSQRESLGGFDYKLEFGEKRIWNPTFLWYANTQPALLDVEDTPNEVDSTLDTRTIDHPVLTMYDNNADIPNIFEEFTPCHNSKAVCKLITGQVLSCGIGPATQYMLPIDSKNEFTSVDPPQRWVCAVSLSQTDVNRLELTAKFINRVVELAKLDDPGYTPQTRYTARTSHKATASFDKQTFDLHQFSNFPAPKQLTNKLVALRAPNFDGSVLNNISETSAYLATAWALIPTAYGCVHLGALSIIFPTSVERVLWKVSCYYLIATAGVLAIFSLIVYADELIYTVFQPHKTGTPISLCMEWLNKTWHRWMGSVSYRDESMSIILIILGVIGLFYVSARFYIVIESFTSLRHVRIGVYQTPSLNIMANIPHL
jgi:hypothetical protein